MASSFATEARYSVEGALFPATPFPLQLRKEVSLLLHLAFHLLVLQVVPEDVVFQTVTGAVPSKTHQVVAGATVVWNLGQ